MDSKVADFFKEIDALTVPEELIEEAYKNSAIFPESETVKHGSRKDLALDSKSDQSTLGTTETLCSWQEIRDDSSGYSYYWNVNTNQVTWDCPPEYALYIQSACSGEPNINKKSKKEKKKKESPALPVGAIIPISFYGNSSSEESSDVEKDSVKPPQKEKKSRKASSVKKTKSTKKNSKNKSNDKASSDVIGPQLPPDFQFPVNIPLSPKNNSEITASNATEDISNTELLKSSSVTELSTFEQFVCNRQSKSAVSETAAEILDRKFNELNRVKNEKNPESALKKEGDKVNENTSYQVTSSIFGLRSVVDYDSFTDEEDEEMGDTNPPLAKETTDESKLESMKTVLELGKPVIELQKPILESEPVLKLEKPVLVSEKPVLVSEKPALESEKPELESERTELESEKPELESTKPVPELVKLVYEESVKPIFELGKPELAKDEVGIISGPLFPIISEQKIETITSKRKVEDDTKQLLIKDEPPKKQRKTDINIDKLFAAHSTYGKHGFGFGWQSQPNMDCEPNYRTQKGQFRKTAISFVKSNDVLDLNLLNDDSNVVKSDESDKEIEDETPISAAEVESEDKGPIIAEEESNVPNESVVESNHKDNNSSQAIVLKGEHGDVIINKKKKENTSNEKVAQAVELASLGMEEDIDEIDRALCEALEAKKAAKGSQSSAVSSTGLKNGTGSASVKVTINSSDSDNDVESWNEKERETLFELSTDVIDKLTFLLSNHTALASHNAFLVQLQTRFVDWQAKALDSKYYMARLGEVQDYLQNYEAGLISGNWMCQWDRVNKRYFYVNKTTQVAQWAYPEDSSHSEADSPLNSPQHEFLQAASEASITPENRSQKLSFTSRSKERFASSPPPPPPGVDSPPPLPPHTPPPDRLPPPPPDTAMRRDPEDMDLENSSDISSPPFISRKNVGYLDEEEERCTFPQIQGSPIRSPNAGSSGTGFDDLNTAVNLPQSGSDMNSIHWSQSPIAQRTVSETSVSAEASQSTEIVTSSHVSSNTSQSDSSRPKTSKTATTGVKKEKKKKKLQLGIGLKKKNMPSLVEKWLKIKEEQEKEDNDSEVLKSDSTL